METPMYGQGSILWAFPRHLRESRRETKCEIHTEICSWLWRVSREPTTVSGAKRRGVVKQSSDVATIGLIGLYNTALRDSETIQERPCGAALC